MSSSLITGVSGLQASQTMLDVVGNNLANLNTTGFKSQSPLFSDLLYQTLVPASSSSNNGGTNPLQIGFGTTTSMMETNFTQGALTTTGNPLDLALQGQGFFVVNYNGQNEYTRAGSFNIDANGYLVDPATGALVQRTGTAGEPSGTNPGFQTPGVNNIKVPLGSGISGQATSTVTLSGNLSAQAVGPLAQVLTSGTAFKSGGSPVTSSNAGSVTLNQLDDNVAPYQNGDTITLQGSDTNGNAVSQTIPVFGSGGPGPGTDYSGGVLTMQGLADYITKYFPGSTASFNSSGNLVVTANSTGPSKLLVSIGDTAGDKGGSAWSSHGLDVTTIGKNGDIVNGAIQVYDTQGTPHNLSLTFQKQAANTWNLTASIPSTDGTMINGSVSNIVFNSDGSFRQVSGSGAISFMVNGLSAPQTITFNFGAPSSFAGLTQFGGNSSAAATNQNGYAAGTLSSVSVSQEGIINGIFSNGQIFPLAQLAIAQFANTSGLNRIGQNYFSETTNSGVPLIAGAQAGGRGTIQEGALEESNVDVSEEFTKLITAQQGYAVNARSISVSSQVLQDLTSIIR